MGVSVSWAPSEEMRRRAVVIGESFRMRSMTWGVGFCRAAKCVMATFWGSDWGGIWTRRSFWMLSG